MMAGNEQQKGDVQRWYSFHALCSLRKVLRGLQDDASCLLISFTIC